MIILLSLRTVILIKFRAEVYPVLFFTKSRMVKIDKELCEKFLQFVYKDKNVELIFKNRVSFV